MADQLGIGCDPASVLLPEHLIQSDDRYKAAGDDLLQNCAGTNRRQLITVTYQNESGLIGNRPEQLLCQINIQHGNLIHKDEIRFQHLWISILPVFIGHKA